MSVQNEQAVLGGLLDGADVPRADEHYFAEPIHQELFAELKRRAETDVPRDAVSMKAWWSAKPYAAEMDADHPYLAELQFNAPSHESVQAYADQVKADHDRRELAQIGKTMASQCEADEDPKTVLEDAERQLAGLAETTGQRKTVSVSMALEAALRERGDGIPSGWSDLDKRFNGWRSGRLYIAAGRPGMGKSLFGAGCALNVARRGTPVAFVSLEMSAEEVSVRLAAALSGIPYSQIEREGVWPDDEQKLNAARDIIQRLPFTILDMPGASVGSIRNAVRRLDREHKRKGGPGLGFVCVDYLGLVAPPERGMGLYEATTRNSQALKQTARELGLPVMVLAQLSRAVEQRADKHPMLSDLRDSGAIEQDADCVFALYREAYYAQQQDVDELEAGELEEHMRKLESKALDVDVLKQRGGATGRVKLWCNPATGEILDLHRAA